MARRLWILLLAVCAAFLAVRLHRGGAVQTDLLAMLPATERNPLAERAVTDLARAGADRAVFLVGAADPEGARKAASAYGRTLRDSGAFASVTAELPPIDPGALPRFYAGYRYRLPFQGPLRERVEARLASPLGSLPGLGPDADPDGHVQAFLEGLPAGLRLRMEDGFLVAGGERVVVLAALRGSAFDPKVQAATLAAVAKADAELARVPRGGALRAGAVFHAAHARTRAERETALIGWISLAATAAMFLLVFRSLRHLALGTACILAGVLLAAAATLAAFGHLHLLTLVCGSSLIGVAADYPLLYFSHHLGAGPAWDARGAMRSLRAPLLVGAGTTALGFAALGAAPFPGLRQMAVFSVAGVAGAFLTLLLVLPRFLEAPLPGRPRLLAAAAAAAERLRPSPRILLLGALLLCACLPRLRTDDDVHGLIRPSAALQAQEDAVRALTGLPGTGPFLLVEGDGEGQVLAREEALRQRLRGLSGLEGVQALSSFVPSPASQERALAAWRGAEPELEAALRGAGFRGDLVAAVGPALREAGDHPLTVAAFLATPAGTPFRALWIQGGPRAASAVVPVGRPDPAGLERAAAGLPGVTVVDKATGVTRLLGRYRRLALTALCGALLLVGAFLALRYGPRRGPRILAPALGGMLLALAGTALLGIPLTLFGAVALVLVLGLGVDYTVFLAEGRQRGPAALGVLLAGAATFLSFGLLAFSGTPVLQGFGTVLLLGLLGSLLLSPLALEHP